METPDWGWGTGEREINYDYKWHRWCLHSDRIGQEEGRASSMFCLSISWFFSLKGLNTLRRIFTARIFHSVCCCDVPASMVSWPIGYPCLLNFSRSLAQLFVAQDSVFHSSWPTTERKYHTANLYVNTWIKLNNLRTVNSSNLHSDFLWTTPTLKSTF